MRLIASHINVWASAVMLVFLLTSAGVTAVIEICCEEPESAKSNALEQPVEADGHASDEDLPSAGVPHIRQVDDCHQRFIAGGLSGMTAVVEKESSSRTTKNLLPAPVAVPARLSARSSNSSSNLLLSRGPSPPSVDKCVLTSTFLI